MNKNMIIVYVLGFVVLTIFGIFYYQDILFKPEHPTTKSVSLNEPEKDSIIRKYNVQGMYCDACKNKIESAVSNIKGVMSVSVDQSTNEMIVTYRIGQENIKETLAAVNELGYKTGLKSVSGKLQVLDFNVTFQ